ncbi:MAG: hypothetical protein L3K15_00020 [Thermoplasmata archaeon]|nr:hypothetical protein [Thermoplasmata archaeon]
MKSRRKAGWSRMFVAGFVVGATVLVLLGGLIPVEAVGLHGGATGATGRASASSGDIALASARASLAVGAGPAGGAPWTCQPRGGGVACSAAAASHPSPLIVPTPGWSTVAFGPSPRVIPGGSGLVYDAADAYVLLFGGTNGTPKADTWSFAGGLWTHLHPKTAPSPRFGSAMAYDPPAGYVLLFGGYNGVTTFSDTWSFLNGQWTHLTPATTPAKLVEAVAAYDANDSYVVLFGGLVGPALTTFSHATYTFFSGNWHLITPATSPPGRFGAAMAFDVLDGWVVMFGGYNGTSGYLGDTWNFSAGHWNNRTAGISVAPRARAFSAMAYDNLDKSLILFGGQTSTGAHLGDTWSFARGLWSHQTPAFAPAARLDPGLAAVTGTGGVIMFGGERNTGVMFGDTWTFGSGVWKHVLPPQPSPRAEGIMTYDEADGYVLLFGGLDLGQSYGDTWTFNGILWHKLHPSIAPGARDGAVMAYDGADGYVVLWGGQPHGGVKKFNDTWTFLGGIWRPLPLPSSLSGLVLPGAALATMAYDAADGYLVMFGGINYTGIGTRQLSYTYAFLDGNWTNVTPSVSPPARDLAGMAFDSWDGEIVLFGGENTAPSIHYLNDTWTWAAGTWTNATSPIAPSQREAFQIVYDENHGYVLLTGGFNGGSTPLSDTWSFVGGVWTKLAPSTPAPAVAVAGIAFDAKTSSVVLFGGITNVSTQGFAGTTWVY